MSFDLGLSEDQEQLLDICSTLFEKESSSEKVRASEPLGYSPELWERVQEMGLTTMSLPETVGGGGASLFDAALVSERAGRWLAPVPLVETVAATRLLAAVATEKAHHLLAGAASGPPAVTLALGPALEGTLRWVPAGAVAGTVVLLDGSKIVATADTPPGRAPANLGSLPLAHRSTDRAVLVAEGDSTPAAFAGAVDEWRVLSAAWLVGAARHVLDIAVAYTTERRAFGAPIASYQSVAHRMADIATATDGAELLTQKAAWAADTGNGRRHELALMAYSFAAEVAESAATESLHVHGGYGFMLEYDPQLYLRRVKAVGALNGDPAQELQHLADALWGAPAGS